MGASFRGRVVSIGLGLGLGLAGCSGDDGQSGSNATGGTSAMGGKANGASSGSSGKQSTGGLGSSLGSGGASGGSSAGAGTGGSVDLMSDPGSGMCTNFTPCGGDVSGTWQIESLCGDFLGDINSCPGAQVTFTFTGSLTFEADGNYSAKASVASHVVFPAACSSFCGATCAPASDGGCACDSTSPLSAKPSTYSVSGNRLLLTDVQSGVVQAAYYCVSGAQLYLRGYSTNGSPYQYSLHR